jgi:hypothetical protein
MQSLRRGASSTSASASTTIPSRASLSASRENCLPIGGTVTKISAVVPDRASYLRIEERELQAGGLN